MSLYPNEIPILRNYANLIRESSPSKALSIHLSLLRDRFRLWIPMLKFLNFFPSCKY